MQVPFHAMIVHFPLALTFLIPFAMLIFAYMIQVKKMTPQAWLMVIGLQMALTISGYVALESGENEEHLVEKVLDKTYIHEHEEASEIFVGSTVVMLVLSIAAFFLKNELQFKMQLLVALLSITSCYLAYRAGKLGGELVYHHGAARAYIQEAGNGLLPTPGKNTSESPMPVNENESLKVDENDYGNGENTESYEEPQKQED